MNILKIKKLTKDAILPEYAHPGDAGLDLFSNEDKIIEPQTSALVKTGISIELPEKMEGQIRPRSGLALKKMVTLLNSPGTIDEGYRGELGIIMINHSNKDFKIHKGMKIAQMIIAPVIQVKIKEVKELSKSIRSHNGFGSTGENKKI